MQNVVFVAPFGMETTLRFVTAVAELDDVRLGLVTQDPLEKLPQALQDRLAAHWRAADALDSGEIAAAVQRIAGKLGRIGALVGTLEQLQVPLAEARAALGVPGMNIETARNFRDKSRMKTVLRAAGVPCARHQLAAAADAAWRFAEEVGYPRVLKPPEGAGAKATFRVDDPGQLGQALEVLAPAAGREVLVEEFITGEEHSFDTVSIGGRPVWHSISRYAPTPLEVLRNPWIQWCVLVVREVDDERYEDIHTVGVRALAALGMGTGVSHMEWFRRRDGSLAISEVAARPPGAQFCTLISYANDFDFYRAWARVVVHAQFDPPKRRYACGAAYLRGQGSGRVKAVHGLEQAQKELGDLVVESRLPKPGQRASGTYEGEGYVILRHPETQAVEEGLRRLVSLIHVELG